MNSLQEHSEASEEYSAREAGMDVTTWRALPKTEKIRLQENYEDSKFAADQGVTLTGYRARLRRQFENGAFWPEYGAPSWLRDKYALEKPVQVAVEYLRLLTEGAAAHGPALKEIIRSIQAHIRRGWIGDEGMTFEDAKALLLEEINRCGLRDVFEEAKAQQAESANQ